MRAYVLPVVAALLLAGCAERMSEGGGEDTDACGGYAEYESLSQPVPTDSGDVIGFADAFVRILRRVQLDERVTNPDGKLVEVDAKVAEAYGTLEDEVETFRQQVREADGDPAQVKAAVAALTDSEAFAAADRTIAEFYMRHCDRDTYPTR